MLNKVHLIGRIGQIETFQTQSGNYGVNLSVATNEYYKDKHGQKQENTEWHRCVAWMKLADIISQYAHKGQLVWVEGKLATHQYQAQDGSTRYSTQIVISEFKMLGGNKNATNQQQNNNYSSTGDQYADDPPYTTPYEDDVPY